VIDGVIGISAVYIFIPEADRVPKIHDSSEICLFHENKISMTASKKPPWRIQL
jgi:hypothetical protein